MKKLSEEEIQNILDSTKASAEMDGDGHVSPEATEISRRYLRGEISSSKAKELIFELHGLTTPHKKKPSKK